MTRWERTNGGPTQKSWRPPSIYLLADKNAIGYTSEKRSGLVRSPANVSIGNCSVKEVFGGVVNMDHLAKMDDLLKTLEIRLFTLWLPLLKAECLFTTSRASSMLSSVSPSRFPLSILWDWLSSLSSFGTASLLLDLIIVEFLTQIWPVLTNEVVCLLLSLLSLCRFIEFSLWTRRFQILRGNLYGLLFPVLYFMRGMSIEFLRLEKSSAESRPGIFNTSYSWRYFSVSELLAQSRTNFFFRTIGHNT